MSQAIEQSEPHRSPRNRTGIHALAQYLFTLAGVMACYFLYLKFAVPWIEPDPQELPPVVIMPTAEILAPPMDKTRLVSLLPKDAWELESCQSLLTEQGTLLFQDIQQQENGTVRVVPFTLVSGLGQDDLIPALNPKLASGVSTDRTPTVMRCMAGANLKFNRPIDEALQEGNASLELATLTGDVDIYRPPTRQDGSDILHLLTRNVQVDRYRIYTVEEVRFSYGAHRGSGRNLSIDLAHRPEVAAAERGFETIDGIARLELAFLDRLRLEPSEDGEDLALELKPSDPSVANRTSMFRKQSPLEVRCAGPVVFDFQTRQIALQDQVVVRQLDRFQNSVQCDRMTLVFENGPETVDPKAKPSLGGAMKLKQLVATGTPALVTVNSQPAKISSSKLVYDAQTRRLEGRSASEGRFPVTLITPEIELVTDHLQYSLTEDGSLGPIYSQAAGRLLHRGKRPDQQLRLSWQEQLVSRQDPAEPDLQSIVVQGQAHAVVQDQFDVSADNLTFHLSQFKDADGNWQYQPAQLVARQDVVVESPKLSGRTRRLTVHWPGNDQRQSAQLHRVGRVRYGIQDIVQSSSTTWGRLSDPAASPPNVATRPSLNRQFREIGASSQQAKLPNVAIAPVAWQEAVPVGTPPSVEKRIRKLDFEGADVVAILAQKSGGKPEEVALADLVVRGAVTVVQTEQAENQPQRDVLTMHGDYLRVIPHRDSGNPKGEDDPELFQAVIESQVEMARIATRDFSLKGRKINLDQLANKLGVHGEGEMQLAQPVVDPAGQGGQLRAQAGNETLRVQWSGGMIFDGGKIYFEHRVELIGERQERDRKTETEAYAEALSVELSRTLDFKALAQQPKAGKLSDVEAKELVFVDSLPDSQRAFAKPASTGPMVNRGLEIKNRVYDLQGKQLEQQVVVARQAVVDLTTQDVDADGPGHVSIHRFNPPQTQSSEKSNGGPLAMFSRRQSSALSFIRANFDDRLDLNAEKKQLSITGRIRTAYRGVQTWDQTVDPDQVTGQQADTVLVTSQRMDLAQWQPRGAQEPVNELIVSGNVRVVSQEFDVSADRMSYDQSADALALEGTSRTDAVLKYYRAGQRDRAVATGKKFRYHFATESVSGDEIRSIKAEVR